MNNGKLLEKKRVGEQEEGEVEGEVEYDDEQPGLPAEERQQLNSTQLNKNI